MKGDGWIREDGGVKKFLKEIIDTENLNLLFQPEFYFSGELEGVTVEIVFIFTVSENIIIKSFVNDINTHEGGTHVWGFRDALTRALNKIGDDILVNYQNSVELINRLIARDILPGIVALISIKFSDPNLGGYSNSKLENPEIGRIILQILEKPLEEFFKQNEQYRRKLLNRAGYVRNYRKAISKKLQSQTNRKAPILPRVLIRSFTNNPLKRELYIVDGQSTGGAAVRARNAEFQEILFITNKINLNRKDEVEFIDQNNLRNIITAIGMGEDIELNKSRYGKIFLLIEQRNIDLLIFLLKYFNQNMRPLIETSRLYIVFPPVYSLKATGKLGKFLDNTKNSLYELIKDKYFASNIELQSFVNKIKDHDILIDDLFISKFSGMGELNTDQFDEAIMSPDSRKIQQISKYDVEDDVSIGILLKDLRIQLAIDRLNREYLSTPNSQDGLKPIHRRFLLAMDSLGLNHDSNFKRSSRILGELFGKYHPIEAWAYESIVKLGQEWYSRYPFANFMGNIGSIDGFPPTDMSFTEVRPFKIGTLLTKDLSPHIADFVYNFNQSTKEPLVLPSPFPNLLINGGFDSYIPTHNLVEVLNACILLIDFPDKGVEELMKCITGPDYPTGGIIVGKHGVKSLYTSGKGQYILRARSHFENTSYGDRLLVIDEIPYLINKADIITQISKLIDDNAIHGIIDVKDLSKNEIRIEIEITKGFPKEFEISILAQLLLKTDLAIIVNPEITALHNEEVTILNLRESLLIFLGFRRKCILSIIEEELRIIKNKIHILKGSIIASNNADKFSKIITSAEDDKDAKSKLMEEFDLSEIQTSKILHMNFIELILNRKESELDKLVTEHDQLSLIISDTSVLDKQMKEEFIELISEYSDGRRTKIVDQDDLIYLGTNGSIETKIGFEIPLPKKRDLLITSTSEGYLRTIDYIKYQRQGSDRLGVTSLPLSEDEHLLDQLVCNNLDILLLVTNRGVVHRLPAYEIPEVVRHTARGMVSKRFIPIEGNIVKIVNVDLDKLNHDHELVITTMKGSIEQISLDKFVDLEPTGLSCIILIDDDQILDAHIL